jgi:hypothetical protein
MDMRSSAAQRGQHPARAPDATASLCDAPADQPPAQSDAPADDPAKVVIADGKTTPDCPKRPISDQQREHLARIREKAAIALKAQREAKAKEKAERLATAAAQILAKDKRDKEVRENARLPKTQAPRRKHDSDDEDDSDSSDESSSSDSSSSSNSSDDDRALRGGGNRHSRLLPEPTPRRKAATKSRSKSKPKGKASLEKHVARLERQMLKMRYKARYAGVQPAAAPMPQPVIVNAPAPVREPRHDPRDFAAAMDALGRGVAAHAPQRPRERSPDEAAHVFKRGYGGLF